MGRRKSEGRVLRPWEAAAGGERTARNRARGAGPAEEEAVAAVAAAAKEGTGAGAGEPGAAEAGDGGWPGREPGRRRPRGTPARDAHPAAAAGAWVRASRRPAGAGRLDGAAARAPRARRPQPNLGGTGGYRAREHPLSFLFCLLPPSPSP